VYAIASKVRAVIAPFADNLVWVRITLGALLASGIGLAIFMAFVISRTLDSDDEDHLARRLATSVSTGAINSVSQGLPGSANAVTDGSATIGARDLREAIDELTAKGPSGDGAAEASVEGGTARPSPTVIDALRAPDETSSVGTEDPDKRVGLPKRIQRRAKSIAQRDSSSKYHQVPKGTEKMFDANWQSKAFAFE
jgi:hypothetical protein